MSGAPPPSGDDPSQGVPSPTEQIAPDDLAKLLMASAMMPTPGDAPGKASLRKKLLIAALIAAVGLGASIMSCVGQSFSYRSAHALEGIEQQLKEIRASCSSGTSIQPPRENAP